MDQFGARGSPAAICHPPKDRIVLVVLTIIIIFGAISRVERACGGGDAIGGRRIAGAGGREEPKTSCRSGSR